jgi:hypothetical protein
MLDKEEFKKVIQERLDWLNDKIDNTKEFKKERRLLLALIGRKEEFQDRNITRERINGIIEFLRTQKQPVKTRAIMGHLEKSGLFVFSENPIAHLSAILSHEHRKGNNGIVRVATGLYALKKPDHE